MNASALPAGFEALAPFVAYWARDTTDARLAARCEASMADIQAFYDTMLPLSGPALALLDSTPPHKYTPPLATLAQLVLSLAQAAVAVEMHGQPLSPNTPWPNSVRVTGAAAPYA